MTLSNRAAEPIPPRREKVQLRHLLYGHKPHVYRVIFRLLRIRHGARRGLEGCLAEAPIGNFYPAHSFPIAVFVSFLWLAIWPGDCFLLPRRFEIYELGSIRRTVETIQVAK